MLKLVVAMDKRWLIGKNSTLPWNVPQEIKHFKDLTLNKTIVFGDVTMDSIKKRLSGRKIIVLTDKKGYKKNNVEVINDFNEIVKRSKNEDIFIAGGRQIYELFLPYVEELHISLIKGNFKGNVYFPKINRKLYTVKKIKESKVFDYYICEKNF